MDVGEFGQEQYIRLNDTHGKRLMRSIFSLIRMLIGEPSICTRCSDVLNGGCSLWGNHCSTANPGSASQPTSTGGLNTAALLILHFVAAVVVLFSQIIPTGKKKQSCNWIWTMSVEMHCVLQIKFFFFHPSLGLARVVCQEICSGRDMTLVSKSTSKTGPMRGLLYLWT